MADSNDAANLLFVCNDYQTPYCNNMILQDCTYVGRGKTANKYSLLFNDGEVRLAEKPVSVVHGEVWRLADAKLASMDAVEGVASLEKRTEPAAEEEQAADPFGVARAVVKVLVTEEGAEDEKEVPCFAYVTQPCEELDDWTPVKSGMVQAVIAPDKDTPSEGDDASGEEAEESEEDFIDDPGQPLGPVSGVGGVFI
ncbi:hypothetical protein DIPPA_07945 [Diplonema papillatum]|nr:hypothetical protein DIPPA_07945 [Diplonema papillatum]